MSGSRSPSTRRLDIFHRQEPSPAAELLQRFVISGVLIGSDPVMHLSYRPWCPNFADRAGRVCLTPACCHHCIGAMQELLARLSLAMRAADSKRQCLFLAMSEQWGIAVYPEGCKVDIATTGDTYQKEAAASIGPLSFHPCPLGFEWYAAHT